MSTDNLMTVLYFAGLLAVAAGGWLLLPAAGLIIAGASAVVTAFLHARGTQHESEQA